MLKRSVKNLSVLACAVEGGLLGSNAHRTGINGLAVNGSENGSENFKIWVLRSRQVHIPIEGATLSGRGSNCA